MVKVIIRKKSTTNNTDIIKIITQNKLELINKFKKYYLTPIVTITKYNFEKNLL